MATQILAANNAQSVLAAGISSSATSLTVNTGTGALFPSPVSGTSFFKLTLIDAATGNLTEIMHVTARSGDVMTVDRAQEGTVARAWSANDIVANMMTAGTLAYILSNFQPLDATLTAIASLVGAANKLAYFNGVDTAALTDLTSVGRDIIGKTTTADVLLYLGLGDGSGRYLGTRVFTASGTYTPTAGTKKVVVTVVGGGGGGGGTFSTNASQNAAGSGGGGGAEAVGVFTTGFSGVAMVIGSAGVSAAGANGTDGGTTSFGSLLTAAGGGGGPRGLAATSGNTAGSSGGVTVTGTPLIVRAGQDGGAGTVFSVGTTLSGKGGDTSYGYGGSPGGTGSTAGSGSTGNTGKDYGSGGAGASGSISDAARSGGSGRTGVIIVEEYA